MQTPLEPSQTTPDTLPEKTSGLMSLLEEVGAEALRRVAQRRLDARQTMTSEEYREHILSLAPKREDFEDEESYLEARDGFRHRTKTVLAPLRTPSAKAKD